MSDCQYCFLKLNVMLMFEAKMGQKSNDSANQWIVLFPNMTASFIYQGHRLVPSDLLQILPPLFVIELSTYVLAIILVLRVHNLRKCFIHILLFESIDLKKATGFDKLSVKILRLALPFGSLIITDILNNAIEERTFPSQWIIALVTPLHKGGVPNTI